MNDGPAKQVICPACKKKGPWFAGKHGPFCSNRCKLVDLGKWFGGEHIISEPLHGVDLEAIEKDKSGALDTTV